MSIGILSCVWQRPERLPYTLGRLVEQTETDWHLYLINNNRELVGYVDDLAGKFGLPATVIHNDENRGPFARWEVAHEHADKHSHFMTLDDDLNFGPDLLLSWWAQANDDVQGWRGWRFRADYWDRKSAAVFELCDYVWGSNMLVPSGVVADERILDLERDYWQADDLWACYVAGHLQGRGIRRGDVSVAIEIDGKDTYLSQRTAKVAFLDELRARGWQV